LASPGDIRKMPPEQKKPKSSPCRIETDEEQHIEIGKNYLLLELIY
jgi:hypothetical protein